MSHGAFILGCAGPRLAPEEAAFFAQARPFGFILFARNVESPDQLRRLTGDLRDSLGWEAPVLIDQEGGRVQRMTRPHWAQYLPPLDQVRAAGDKAERAMYLRGALIAQELRAVGIDVNCTPCADVARPDTHPFLQNRCYSDDPAQVARLARALVQGTTAGGVQSVMKHMPGHGLAKVDSHLHLPQVSLPRAELDTLDFAPFRALNDLPFGMTAHIVFADIDATRPATASPDMIRLIRDDIGFVGFLMTDDISMQALSGDLAARCETSLAAGCDAVLHCNGDLDEMRVVADSCGAMCPAAQMRAEAALAARPKAENLDTQALADELNALVKGAVVYV